MFVRWNTPTSSTPMSVFGQSPPDGNVTRTRLGTTTAPEAVSHSGEDQRTVALG